MVDANKKLAVQLMPEELIEQLVNWFGKNKIPLSLYKTHQALKRDNFAVWLSAYEYQRKRTDSTLVDITHLKMYSNLRDRYQSEGKVTIAQYEFRRPETT